jgi:hypothetical protein
VARPSLERPPAGLDDLARAAWEQALAAMKRAGVWDLALLPLLTEYVLALQEARHARERGHHAAWDRASRRAMSLADQLVLTPRAQREHGRARPTPASSDDPFAALDAAAAAENVVSLRPRRGPRAG